MLGVSTLQRLFSQILEFVKLGEVGGKEAHAQPYALKTASIHRAWTRQGVESVPQGCWPMLTPVLPTVVSSWLDVLWMVDRS